MTDEPRWALRRQAAANGFRVDEGSDDGPVFRGRCVNCGETGEWSGSYVAHWQWWDRHRCPVPTSSPRP